MNPTPREHEPMLGALARSAERANTPTAMVAFCAALLLGSGLFAAWQHRDANHARAELRQQVVAAAKVRTLADQIKMVRAEQALGGGAAAAYEPKELLGAISRAAEGAKIVPPPSVRETREETTGPLTRKIVTANVRGHAMDHVLDWIRASVNDVPGLHVVQMTARTSPTDGWDIEIRFARWELKSK